MRRIGRGHRHRQEASGPGHALDRDRLIGELGDVAWYLAETAAALDVDLETVLERNIEKLKRRYPEGFDAGKSIDRAE